MTDRRTRETELDPTPAAAAWARRLLRELAGVGDDEAAADTASRAELALSEVVTNAVTHGRPPVSLRLTVEPGRITATVTDSGRAPMHLRTPRPDDVHGRGLAIVASVATAWGWERPADGRRVVWFTVAEALADGYPGLVPCV